MPTTEESVRAASFPESQGVVTEPEAPPAPPHIRSHHTLIVMILTFGVPAYHASLATVARDNMLGKHPILSRCKIKHYLDLKAIFPALEAVRDFDTVLFAYVIYHCANGG